MDRRLSLIPPFPNLKIFKNGLQNIKRFTASEYRDIMKVAIFTIDGIISSINKKMDIMITQLFYQWIVMYIMSRNDNHTEETLQEFKNARFTWAKTFISLLQNYSPSGLSLVKLHSWLYHVDESIRKYGSMNGWNTETFESLHKDYVKKPYRISNKRDINTQIIGSIRRKLVLNLLNPINNTTKINSTFTKNIKLTSPGIEFLLSDFNNAFMDLSDKGAHELTLLGMNQLSRKLLLLFCLKDNSLTTDLAVIQWFDFKYQSEDLRLKHGCPYVKLLDEYDIIPIESITDLIHVIPHFGHDNSFFVNSFLF
ncbi:hypothetical protein RhiirB3_502125 [Rhizophagus irregularis]|nr:hypothetical protein RhiirB3_502125 [Rhizophagus irregularis]